MVASPEDRSVAAHPWCIGRSACPATDWARHKVGSERLASESVEATPRGRYRQGSRRGTSGSTGGEATVQQPTASRRRSSTRSCVPGRLSPKDRPAACPVVHRASHCWRNGLCRTRSWSWGEGSSADPPAAGPLVHRASCQRGNNLCRRSRRRVRAFPVPGDARYRRKRHRSGSCRAETALPDRRRRIVPSPCRSRQTPGFRQSVTFAATGSFPSRSSPSWRSFLSRRIRYAQEFADEEIVPCRRDLLLSILVNSGCEPRW